MTKAIMLAALVACADRPAPDDSGYDPSVSECCWRIVFGEDAVRSCLRELTPPGRCRWLTCLGGVVEYEECRE